MSAICSIMMKAQIPNVEFSTILNEKTNKKLYCAKRKFLFTGHNAHLETTSVEKSEIKVFDSNYEILLYGCLYNAEEIKRELIKLGHEFQTDYYEEIILCAYKEWADDCIKKFNGAFCFIVFDKMSGSILFGRDRLGKKNLYYYSQDDVFVIATELKVFFNCDFIKKEINADVLGSYMRFGYVPSPHSVLKNVYKVKPGTVLKYMSGNIVTKEYWSPLSAYKDNCKNQISDYTDAKKQLDKLLKKCIEERIENNKRFGVYLSSGIDSSLVASLTQNICDKRIDTYTIGVNNLKYNEADIAKRIAEHLGTNHHEHYISEKDFLSVVSQIPVYYDEPFGDSSMVPSMVLADFVKEDLDIALGGDGGDEIFCGYPHYKVLPMAQKMDFIGGALSVLLPEAIKNKLPSSVRRVVENRNRNTKSQMIMKSESINTLHEILINPFNKPYYEIEEKMGISNWQIRRMILDMQTTLPDDMIYKVEKAALSSEIDVRAPILDYRILEFSFRLPQKFKYNKKTTKYILRDIVTDYIPAEILNSPKRGFSVPIADWMRSSLREMLLNYSDKNYLEKQNVFSYKGIKNVLEQFFAGNDKHAAICWNYLMFQLWYDKYMN